MVISTQRVRESILCAILANLIIACNNFYTQDVRESILLAGYVMLTILTLSWMYVKQSSEVFIS